MHYVNFPPQLCTTAFLVEISQYIKFGDLTISEDAPRTAIDTEPPDERRRLTTEQSDENVPSFVLTNGINGADNDLMELDGVLTNVEEDTLLRETTSRFTEWVVAFIRRVILLLENLPEEGTDGTVRGGESEGLWHVLVTHYRAYLFANNSTSNRCRNRCLQSDMHALIRFFIRPRAGHGV